MRRWPVACLLGSPAPALACSFADKEAGAIHFATLGARHVVMMAIGLGMLFVASRLGKAPARYWLPGLAAVLFLMIAPGALSMGGGDCGLSGILLQGLLCLSCLAIATYRILKPNHG